MNDNWMREPADRTKQPKKFASRLGLDTTFTIVFWRLVGLLSIFYILICILITADRLIISHLFMLFMTAHGGRNGFLKILLTCLANLGFILATHLAPESSNTTAFTQVSG